MPRSRPIREKLEPVVQTYGTTYYNGEGPIFAPVACKPESEILARDRAGARQIRSISKGPISRPSSSARLCSKGLPPLNIDKLYVITEDDQLRDGEMVLFIGLKGDCVNTVFGLPTKLYRETRRLGLRDS